MALSVCRHMAHQPSVKQWVLHLFPSIQKSLGRSCEQLLSRMSAVHSALVDFPRQRFPPEAGKGGVLQLYLRALLC